MSKSALKIAPALMPRSSRSVPVSPCVFYKLHEGTGTAIADAYGNGPALALAGTGTPWANKGWVTPNGTDAYISVASSAYLQNLLRLDQSFGQIILAFDLIIDGDLTGNENILSFGRNATSGHVGVILSSAEQVQIETRGIGASAATTTTMGASALTGVTTRKSVLLEFVQVSASTMDIVLYYDGVQISVASAVYLLADGASAPPGSDEGSGYTIGARNAATLGARERWINSGASNGQYARVLMMRRATRDAQLAADLALELFRFPGEKPVCLNGK